MIAISPNETPERWPEKSAGVLWYCGWIALIFLDLLLRFASRQNENIDVEFSYELSEIDQDGIIIITDINGKQIHNISVDQQNGIKAWDIRKIPAGSYIYTFKTKYFEKSGKLIIQ